jgi:probable rRNA maturation factor
VKSEISNLKFESSSAASVAKSSSQISITALAGRRFTPFLQKQLPRAARLMRSPLRELSVVLVGDRRMAELHQQYLGIAGPTDVLTFPLEEDRKRNVTAGEIVICTAEAARVAKRLGTAVERELLLYALHGMLHLLGHDDRTDAGFRTMHRTEDAILTQLGLGPQFAIHPRPPVKSRG